MKKILFITLSNLGDVILTLPVLQALLERYPGSRADVIAGAGVAMVFEADERIRQFIPYDKKSGLSGRLALLQKIRGERYDIVIDLRRSIFGFFSGAKQINSYFDFPKKNIHRAKRHFRALRALGITEPPAVSFLEALKASSLPAEAAGIDFSGPVIVAACGSKSHIKQWPADYFAKLLDHLIEKENAFIVLAGDRSDMEISKKVQALMLYKPGRALNLAGKTNFREFASLLAKSSLLITNDSAPLHLADALKTPVLAIFGPTDPRKYGPRGRSTAVVRRTLFCSPCEEARCRYALECLKDLSVDEVFKKSRALLHDLARPQISKILVIRLDRIGDVMLSMPAIRAIRQAHPAARISVMTRPETRILMERNPDVDEVIAYDYSKRGRHGGIIGNYRFLKEIHKQRFDIAFILHPSVRSHLVPFVTGIPYRIGFDSGLPWALTTRVHDTRSSGNKHESEYTLDIVRAMKIPTPTKLKTEFNLFADDEASSAAVSDRQTLVLHAGASDASKKWPVERFAEVGERAVREWGCRVAVVGGNSEKELGDFLSNKIPDCVDLTGKLKLNELAALLSRSKLLITNDSGPVHVASAVGTPTVCIFGRTRPGLNKERWTALGPKNAALQKNAGCVICLAHDCSIDFECLKIMDADTVFEAACSLWQSS